MKRHPTPLSTLYALIERLPEKARTEAALDIVSILTHTMISDNDWSPHAEGKLTYDLKVEFDLPIESWERQRYG